MFLEQFLFFIKKEVIHTISFFFNGWEAKDLVPVIVSTAAFYISLKSSKDTKLQKNVASNQYKLSLFGLRKEVYEKINKPRYRLLLVEKHTIALQRYSELSEIIGPYEYIFDNEDKDNVISEFIKETQSTKRLLIQPGLANAIKIFSSEKGGDFNSLKTNSENPELIQELIDKIIKLYGLYSNVYLYISNQLRLPSDPTKDPNS